MKTILYVCTANVCRSPAAAALTEALAEERNLEVVAHSAGTRALKGNAIAPLTEQALDELGVRVQDHRARQVSREMIEDASLTLVMHPEHAEAIRAVHGSDAGNVLVLPEYIGGSPGSSIPDPYGNSISAHRAAVRLLLDCAESVLDRVQELR